MSRVRSTTRRPFGPMRHVTTNCEIDVRGDTAGVRAFFSKRLFMTASQSLYSVYVSTQNAAPDQRAAVCAPGSPVFCQTPAGDS